MPTCAQKPLTANLANTAKKPAAGKAGSGSYVAANPAANETQLYLSYLKGKKIGMVVNPTSIIGAKKIALVDSLVKVGIQITKIYGPEHGFRGNASDGATVSNEVDAKTKIPVVSLYGKNNKPTPADLKGINLMVFDIQDVGARFYTYISTLHYVMEACAENNIELMVLDRPNPNGFYVDGPVLDTAFKSFVGMHPIPVVHGMTIAEYAQMINGEGWLKGRIKCKLKVVKMLNYQHNLPYTLPVNPSPNLNTAQSILLYPGICFFEGTTLSLGRGTPFPFQVVGHPALKGKYNFSFTPVSIPGVSDNPPQKNVECFGVDYRNYDTNKIREDKKLNLSWLLSFYQNFPEKSKFFIAYFTRLAGTDKLQKQIEAGLTEQQIRQSWEPALSKFKEVRKKYLLYQ
ncbi:DUF1343 domain-containing protein [Mucilaginibacter sp. PAMB04168]|uniref:exo-beta-N-acetylmuramidase NamZ family protein n=1 Tax=Mucilaginibacter sp. PAMB04168 TaxID=3138567 RepID=UPI0031F5FE78